MSEFPTEGDQQEFDRRDISGDEIKWQVSMLESPPAPLVLDRACRLDDGIHRIPESERDELQDYHRRASAQGRWSKFIPASGAASRMFALNDPAQRERFGEQIDQFAFGPELPQQAKQAGNDAIINAVMETRGLGYSDCPKGLVKFHRYQNRTRTAFEEHLLEAAECFPHDKTIVRAHFTVSEQHLDRFAALLQEFRQETPGREWTVSFSVQKPSTDTLAMRDNGDVARAADGAIVMRPGGHGALIENLGDFAKKLNGDLVFVKNIDNVSHAAQRENTQKWIQILGGYLCKVQETAHRHLEQLEAPDEAAIAAAQAFVNATFPDGNSDTDEPVSASDLVARLDRPVRVCGMVKNEDEPGGGPFWVRQADGKLSPQIVETVEVDLDNARQQDIVAQATHFNPVFMMLGLLDRHRSPHPLARFVDRSRVILNQKPLLGATARVLERPGLWNGSMAGWNTIFVEVPGDVFSPVKTVFDLLRPQHQP